MERNANETFAAYKLRRSDANKAVANINVATKGASQTSRERLRASLRANGKLRGTYGAHLRKHFDSVGWQGRGRSK